MPLVMGSDGAELGFVAAGGDNKLVVEKQWRAALALGTALFAVAQHLVDSLGNRLLDLGRFALDQHHRHAVQEQHDVRHDMVLGARNAHLELAYRNKTVVGQRLEIDEPDRRTSLTGQPIFGNTGIFQQQVEQMPVVFQQIIAGEIGRKLLYNFLDLIRFQPRVDHLQLLTQHWQKRYLGKAIPPSVLGGLLLHVQVQHFPLQAFKLVEQGHLDVIALIDSDMFGCLLFHRCLSAKLEDKLSHANTFD